MSIVPRRPSNSRERSWTAQKRSYLRGVREREGLPLRLTRGRWATCGERHVAVLGSSENRPGRWWFGLNEEHFLDPARRALGVILLAEEGDRLLDFGLPRERVETMLPTLSRSGPEVKLNLVRAGDRFLVRATGQDHDITSARGDLSWLPGDVSEVGDDGRLSQDTAEQPSANRAAADNATPAARRFFARFESGVLEPLDDPGLEEGEVVLVVAFPRTAAPSNPLLRRLTASEGPTDLPYDLAEEHDRYAHGSRDTA